MLQNIWSVFFWTHYSKGYFGDRWTLTTTLTFDPEHVSHVVLHTRINFTKFKV